MRFDNNLSYEFSYNYDEKIVTLNKNNNSNDADLVLELPNYLWGAVQNKFYATNLMNCRFFIKEKFPTQM